MLVVDVAPVPAKMAPEAAEALAVAVLMAKALSEKLAALVTEPSRCTFVLAPAVAFEMLVPMAPPSATASALALATATFAESDSIVMFPPVDKLAFEATAL